VIGAIETALIARLNAANTQKMLGYPLNVESYGGQLNTEEDLARFVRRLPCAIVTCTGVGRGEDMGSCFKEQGTFAVLCVARSLRNEQAARHGGMPGEVGTYQIRNDVMTLLCGQTLGLRENIEPLSPYGTRVLFNGMLKNLALSVVAVEFRTAWTVEPAADSDAAELMPGDAGAGITDFTLFSGGWDVPVPGIGDEVTLHKE